jgi:hypothetical protein
METKLQQQQMYMEMMQTAGLNTMNSRLQSSSVSRAQTPAETSQREIPLQTLGPNQFSLLIQGQHCTKPKFGRNPAYSK